jgi:hypothetical protein
MASGVPKGWEKDSDKLFIHETGIRIARMTYKGKDGWYLVPVDLDAVVLEFEPTPEGRDKAFEAFAKGALVIKPKKTKVTKKAVAKPVAKEEEGDEKDKDKVKDKEKDDDEDDDDEDEKGGDEDEGDEA